MSQRVRLWHYGIYTGCLFCGCILYADDIVLLSGSCYRLRKLLDICGNYGIEWDTKFTPGKSVACFLVGGPHQLEMFNFSYKSYSGQHGLNIFDVSLNVILVILAHSLLFVNFMVQLTIYCVRLAERETKWWLFI